jgi:hypothetical protein
MGQFEWKVVSMGLVSTVCLSMSSGAWGERY